MDKELSEEYKTIVNDNWTFLNNTYQSNIKKPYHRTKISNYRNIQNIKKEVYEILGAIPVFIFLTEIISHVKMPNPINNIEKGILLLKLFLDGCSISQMNIYDEGRSFYKVYESVFILNSELIENWIDKMLSNCFSNNIVRMMYSNIYNPPNFEQCTLLLDGKHNKVTIEDIELDKKDLYSYKTKGNALNTQFVIDSAGYLVYVSDSLPCKYNNDDNMLINNVNLMKFFKVTDCLCFDGLYENVISEVINKYENIGLNISLDNFCFPIKKEKLSDLMVDEANFNKQLGSYRSIIETFFANFGKTFKRFSHTSDIRVTKEKTYNIILKLCLVLYNIKIFVKKNNIEENSYYMMWLQENFDFFHDVEDFNVIRNTSKTQFRKEHINNISNIQKDALSKYLSELNISKNNNKNKMDIDCEIRQEKDKFNETEIGCLLFGSKYRVYLYCLRKRSGSLP